MAVFSATVPSCKHADFDYAQDPAHPYGCGADMPDRKCPVCGADYEKDGFHIPWCWTGQKS